MHVSCVARIKAPLCGKKLVDAGLLKFAKGRDGCHLGGVGTRVRAFCLIDWIVIWSRCRKARHNHRLAAEFGDLAGNSGIGSHQSYPFGEPLAFKCEWEIE